MKKKDAGRTPTKKKKPKIDVQLQYLENLTQVNIDLLSVDGKPLSGQDILDAVSETLILKWEHYDLDEVPEFDA